MAKEKVVICGAGGIAGAWLPAIKKEKLSVAAIVDLNIESAYRRIKEYELTAEASTDFEAMLRKHKPDFVLDLTVPEAHCAVTVAALRNGCNVIGEKPMAADMSQARKMVAAAEAAKKVYMVSQSRRWESRHLHTRAMVAGGKFGTLTAVNCDFYIGAHFGGFRDRMPSPLILDMAIHHFDLARYLTGEDPVSVYCHEFNPKGSWYDGNVAASCIFEMTNNVVFTYRGSWCAMGCHTSWNGDWRLVSDKGTILMEKDQEPRGEVAVGTTGFHWPTKELKAPKNPLKFTGMHGGLRSMLDYLRKGTLPATECHDNIKSLAMVFAAIKSAKTGKRVAIQA